RSRRSKSTSARSAPFPTRARRRACGRSPPIAARRRGSAPRRRSWWCATVSERGTGRDGGATQSRALFLMHNYTDIDHMTPVIHALCASGRWHCAVLSYPLATQGSVDFDRDWRFGHVRAAHGVEVERIERAAPEARRLIRLFRFRKTLTRWCDAT